MSNKKMMLRGVLLMSVLAWVTGGIQAQPVVSPSPSTNIVSASTEFTVSLNVTYVSSIRGASVTLIYDRRVVIFESAAAGSLIAGTLMMPPSIAAGVGTTFDTLVMDQARLGPGSSSGAGTLFTVTFASTLVGSTPLLVQKADLRDINNQTIVVTLQNGQASIQPVTSVYVDASYSSANAGGHFWGYNAFSTITNGLNALLSSGDTLNVASGTYNETVNVTKNVLLAAAGTPSIQNLTMNTSQLTLGGDINITGILTLTSGVLATGSNKVIIDPADNLPGAVVATGGSINGEIQRPIAAGNSGVYLLTDANTYVDFNGSQSAATITIRVHPGTTPVPAPATTALVHRYYEIACDAPASDVQDLGLSYDYANERYAGMNTLSLVLWRNCYLNCGGGSAAWQNEGGFPSALPYYVKAIGITGWESNWALAEAASALPIQLSSFTGVVVPGEGVRLNWTTLSEINNYGFEMQKGPSASGPFTTIPNSFIHGSGTTNLPHNYAFTDAAAQTGDWFYRLKQIDLDNTVHYTEPIHVSVLTGVNRAGKPAAYGLEQNYPNPFNPTTGIRYSVPAASEVTIEVYDMLGQRVRVLVNDVKEPGFYSLNWDGKDDAHRQVASGVYLLKMKSAMFTGMKKMTLMR